MDRLQLSMPSRCSQTWIHGIKVDPEPNWSLDSLINELNLIESKLQNSSTLEWKTSSKSRVLPKKEVVKVSDEYVAEDFKLGTPEISHQRVVPKAAFVMRFSDSESDCDDDNYDDGLAKDYVIQSHQRVIPKAAFVMRVDEYFLDDDEDAAEDFGSIITQNKLAKMDIAEVALCELNHDYQLRIKEDLRTLISAVETELNDQKEKSSSAEARIYKYSQMRREMDKKIDTHYRRKIAEGLDNHLTALQRDHELKSQIEERKIRSDAHMEAKQKEKALQQEKLQRAKVEEEAKRHAEQVRLAAAEAKKREEKEAAEALKRSSIVSQEKTQGLQLRENRGSEASGSKPLHPTVIASSSALTLEQRRLQMLKELDAKKQSVICNSNLNFAKTERRVFMVINQITRNKDIVSAKARELVKIMNDPSCPQSVTVATFANKIISRFSTPLSDAFACGHVIVRVLSQVPQALDPLLAELNKACIYTVPKHIVYSKSVFASEGSYYKAMGCKEVDEKFERIDYLERIESCMRLYGALVQTEVEGIVNLHGINEGWTWIARFLNSLPANIYTAAALKGFLKTAGYSLFRSYKSQFKKILNSISENFLRKFRPQECPEKGRLSSKEGQMISELISYIDDSKFLVEPEGRDLLKQSLVSRSSIPNEIKDHRQYDHPPQGGFSYYR